MDLLRFPYRNALNAAVAASRDPDESSKPLETLIRSGRCGLPIYERDALRFFQNRTLQFKSGHPQPTSSSESHDVTADVELSGDSLMTYSPKVSAYDVEEPASINVRKDTEQKFCSLVEDCDMEASCSGQWETEPSPSTRTNDGMLGYQWTDPMREALIISISQREDLWSKSSIAASNSWLKEKLWREVAQEMFDQFGISFLVSDMKRVWTNLRRTHRRIRAMQKSYPLKARRWQFYHTMGFLNQTVDETAASDNGDAENLSSPDGQEAFLSGPTETRLSARDQGEAVEAHPASVGARELEQTGEDDVARRRGGGGHRELIQVSVPEIDCLIDTKQGIMDGPSEKSFLYRIDVEDIGDNLLTELTKVYDKMDAAREQVQECLDLRDKVSVEHKSETVRNATAVPEGEDTSRRIDANSVEQFDRDHLKKSCDETLSPSETALLDRLAMDDICLELEETTRESILDVSIKLRKVYHQAALSLFIKESMKSGQLQVLLDAYDDFVYYRRPLPHGDALLLKVVDMCNSDSRKLFTVFFAVIEKYASILNLRCPEPRKSAPRDESEVRSVHEFVEERKKKQKFDVEYLTQVERRRLTEARIALARKTEKCKENVESMMSVLEMLEPSNHEAKYVLKTLKAAEDAYEKAFNEQQQLEKEYEELQSRSHVPRACKKYKHGKIRGDSFAKALQLSAALAQAALRSGSVDLLDNTL